MIPFPCAVFERFLYTDGMPYGLAVCKEIRPALLGDAVVLVHQSDEVHTETCKRHGLSYVLCQSSTITQSDVDMAVKMLHRKGVVPLV